MVALAKVASFGLEQSFLPVRCSTDGEAIAMAWSKASPCPLGNGRGRCFVMAIPRWLAGENCKLGLEQSFSPSVAQRTGVFMTAFSPSSSEGFSPGSSPVGAHLSVIAPPVIFQTAWGRALESLAFCFAFCCVANSLKIHPAKGSRLPRCLHQWSTLEIPS